MNLSYYARKRIKDYLIHIVMLIILLFTLFPIVWMVYTSLKENTDILVGKIPLSHAHNNVAEIAPDDSSIWILTSDGGINKHNRKTLKESDYKSAQTMTSSFHTDDKYIWISSANHGLLRYSKSDLNKKSEFDLKLPSFDKAKVGSTTIYGTKDKIYFSMKYKGFQQVVEFNKKLGKVVRTFNIKNEFSPSQVQSLFVAGDTLMVGLDTGLLSVDIKSGKIKKGFSIMEYLPLGVEKIKLLSNGKLIIAGNNGAYLFDMSSGNVVKNIYPKAVYGLSVLNGNVYIGTNHGFIAYSAKEPMMASPLGAENLFHQIKRDGTVNPGAKLVPSEVVAIAGLGKNLYVGSTFGRISQYNLNSKKVVNSAVARQGHIVVSWVNYVDMWKNVDFGLYLGNSFFICGISMFFAMIFATMAAYALSRFKFPGSKLFSMAILATQMVPGIMFLIPIYSNFVKFSEITGIPIKGTYYGLIFVYSTFFIPFSVWILRGFFAAIPIELEEAAHIDGCSPFQVFWYVVLPLAIPGIIATGIYIFLTAWDELILAWVLTSADTMTIPVGIRNFVGNYQNRFDLIMAAATVATAPVMLLFFLLQKHIVKGLTAVAVKG